MTTEQLRADVATARRALDTVSNAVQIMREQQAELSRMLFDIEHTLTLLERQVRLLREARVQ